MIDPSSHTGRVLAFLADGVPRTTHEISAGVDLDIQRVASIACRLNGAAWLKVDGRRKGESGHQRKVWAITDLGRRRLLEATTEKAGE